MTGIQDVWGLQSELDNKATVRHSHAIRHIAGLPEALAAIEALISEAPGEDVLMSNVIGLTAALDAKAASNHAHALASANSAGFMSAADKTTLDNISTNGGASTIAQVSGLQAALNGKAESGHTHTGLINLSPQLLSYTISQSSTFAGGVHVGTYSNLTDGVFTTGAGTGGGTSEWIKADLDSVQIISRVALAGGTLAGWGTVSNYFPVVLEVSSDDTNWAIVIPAVSGIVDNAITTFAIGAIAARYVRIRKSGGSNNYVGATEFRIFG